MGGRGSEMTVAERTFVDAGATLRARREAEKEAQRAREIALERRSARLTRFVAVVTTVGMLLGVSLAVLALRERAVSETRAQQAYQSALVSKALQLLAEGQADHALAVILEAITVHPPPAAAELALSQIAYAPGTRWSVRADITTVNAIALSADGTRLLAGGREGTLRLYDTARGDLIGQIGQTGRVQDLALAPDGSLAVSASSDPGEEAKASAVVWDVEARKPLVSLVGQRGVAAVAFSPDGRQVITGATDGTVRIWEARSGVEVRRIEVGAPVGVLAVDPTGDLLAANSGNQSVGVWQIGSGERLWQQETAAPFFDLEFSPDGRSLAVAVVFPEYVVSVLQARTGVAEQELKPGSGNVAFTPDGFTVLSGTDPVWVWNTVSGHAAQRPTGSSREGDLVVGPDGRDVYSASDDGNILAWTLSGAAATARLAGHTQTVRALAFSPDGRTVASGSYDHTVMLWDVAGNKASRRLKGHDEVVRSLEFSHDGRQIASTSNDRTAILWDVDTGKALRRLEHADWAWHAVFSPDDRGLLTGAWDGTVRLWRVYDAREVLRLHPRTGVDPARVGKAFAYHPNLDVRKVAIAPDGRTVLAAVYASDNYNAVVVWDVARGQEVERFEEHGNVIGDLLVSHNGRQVISGSADGTVRVRSMGSTDPPQVIQMGGFPFDIALSPDDRYLFVGDVNGSVVAWDMRRAAAIRRYAAHDAGLDSLALSPDGRTLATGGGDGVALLWPVHYALDELVTWIHEHRFVPRLTCEERAQYGLVGACKAAVEGTVAASITTAATLAPSPASTPGAPDATDLQRPQVDAVAPTPASVTAFFDVDDLAASAEPATIPHGHEVWRHTADGGLIGDMTVSADGRWLLTGSGARFDQAADYALRIYDSATGNLETTMSGHGAKVWDVDLSRDGRTAVSGADDGTVIAWEVAGGRSLRQVAVGTIAQSVAIHPDGTQAAVGTAGELGLWRLDGEAPGALEVLTGTLGAVTSVAFGPDGRSLLSGAEDHSVWLWDAAEGTPVRRMGGTSEGHTALVRAVRFAPDGRTAVSADDRGTIIVWQVSDGQKLRTWAGGTAINSLSFSPEGRYLLSTDEDGFVRLWEIAGQREVWRSQRQPGVRLTAGFLPDGCQIVAAGDDGSIVRFDLGRCER